MEHTSYNKKMKIHILMHESFEAPGAIETWAKEHGHTLSYTRFYRNDSLPQTVDNLDYLIVMGGPQSPATSKAECPHFHARTEIEFISEAITKGKLLLGVCLGAQLIGEALGARFEHSPEREIGVFDLTLTPDGKKDPIFSTFPHVFPVGHWHGDMPGLTPAAAILATSKGCPRQVIRYSPRVYGFQCHFEFTPAAIEEMIKNNSNELVQYQSLPYIQNAASLRSHDYAPINRLLFKFLDYMQSIDEAE
jgi:GMP synthase (glutamine-hydrolysing)